MHCVDILLLLKEFGTHKFLDKKFGIAVQSNWRDRRQFPEGQINLSHDGRIENERPTFRYNATKALGFVVLEDAASYVCVFIL